MKNVLALLGGVGIGAFLMYIFDPNNGGERRAFARDKVVGLSNDITETIDKRSRDLGNRAKGLLHDTKAMFTSGADAETEGGEDRQDFGSGENFAQPQASGQTAGGQTA